MPKKLRKEPIYIAPDIAGWLTEDNTPVAFDHRNAQELDPVDLDDKIKVYERQVWGWFLSPAERLAKARNQNNGFLVLMICLSYLEGVEQYRKGVRSTGRTSKEYFVDALNRLYPGNFETYELNEFYTEARCGLFHDGMVRGRILINNRFGKSLKFEGVDILISPTKLLADIKNDFERFISEIKQTSVSRANFDRMYVLT